MSKFIVTEESLTNIANAIRSKTGNSEQLVFPDGFVNSISGIFVETEIIITTPKQAKTIDPGSIVLLGQIEVPSHTKAIKRVSPTSGYNPSNFQHYYNLTLNNSTGEILGINFSLYNKTNKQLTVDVDALTVKVVLYR